MTTTKKIVTITFCIIFLSCDREPEFYPIEPPIIYADKAQTANYGDTLRFDYIVVKNLDVNNPLHLSQVDRFVAKNIATNYADYAGYTICILKYAKIMSRVDPENNSDGKWYVLWSDNLQLTYRWKKGKFCERVNNPLYMELLSKKRQIVKGEYSVDSINHGEYPF